RILAFQRWVEGVGEDVVVVANLNEQTLYGYQIAFPAGGFWREVLNSDAYDSSPGHVTAGNAGGVAANGGPAYGMPASAYIVIPANSILVFRRG
ncbi:MAG TPA: alpha amylase C-terminal domain-containing protein, partial [Polyangiaceae bacterium]|nr:alpha amylase C-terminal domain-containing protein [Polyangiaceae bacterium]